MLNTWEVCGRYVLAVLLMIYCSYDPKCKEIGKNEKRALEMIC